MSFHLSLSDPLVVQLEIADSSPTVILNPSNTTAAAASAAAATAQTQRLYALASSVATLANTGGLNSIGNISVLALAVTGPPALASVAAALNATGNATNVTASIPSIILPARPTPSSNATPAGSTGAADAAQPTTQSIGFIFGISVAAAVVVVLLVVVFVLFYQRSELHAAVHEKPLLTVVIEGEGGVGGTSTHGAAAPEKQVPVASLDTWFAAEAAEAAVPTPRARDAAGSFGVMAAVACESSRLSPPSHVWSHPPLALPSSLQLQSPTM